MSPLLVWDVITNIYWSLILEAVNDRQLSRTFTPQGIIIPTLVETEVQRGHADSNLISRWPSQDLNPHQLTPEAVLTAIEPHTLTVYPSRASPHLSCSPVYPQRWPLAWHREFTAGLNIRGFHVCQLVYSLKFIFNSKSIPLSLSWSFTVMCRMMKNGVT